MADVTKELHLGVVADGGLFLDALAARADTGRAAGRASWTNKATRANRDLMRYEPLPAAEGVDLGRVVAAVNRHADSDCVFAMDSGNFGSWVQRYLVVGREQRLLSTASISR